MTSGGGDIQEETGLDQHSPKLTPETFAAKFQEVSRVLWCIASAAQGDRVRADDLVQEAAVIALRKLDQYTPGTSFVAWMSQIVRYVAANEARRRQRRATAASDPHLLDQRESSPGGQGPGDVISSSGELREDQAGFDDRVVRAMQSLSEDVRCCLLLRTVMGMSYAEVSRALGIPEGTAMSHVHRARAAMRDQLSTRQAEGGSGK